MSAFRVVLPVALSFTLGACSIHPLPDDVTGLKTAQIVHRIRCEAAKAVVDAAENINNEPVDKPWRAAQKQTRLKILASTGIVLSFALTGEETDNVNMASATFTKPLNNGSFSFNPNVGDTLDRKNVRTFTVVDNFHDLAQTYEKYGKKSCETQAATGPNYQYPITGTIGVAEMINTFITLSVHADLAKEQGEFDEPTLSMNTAPTLVDTITFTTSLSAGVTPTWMFMPVGKALQLTNASIDLSTSRKDTHEVIVGLALPGPVSSLKGPPLPINGQPFGLLITGYAHDRAELVALEAVNHHILRFEVGRSSVFVP